MAAAAPTMSEAVVDDSFYLDDDGQLTEAFSTVLRAVFKRFDADGDGIWNVAELNAFAIACNGVPFDADSHVQIREYFIREQLGLTVDGFLDMMHLQVSSDPAETVKDLRKLGFHADLTPMSSSA